MSDFLIFYFIGASIGLATLFFVGMVFCVIHNAIIDFKFRRYKNQRRMLFNERSID